MLPRVFSTINRDGVVSSIMEIFVLVLMLAKQSIAVVFPIGQIEEAARSHRVKLRGRLEPAELCAVLVGPLSRSIGLNDSCVH